jgi:hypothetical protein
LPASPLPSATLRTSSLPSLRSAAVKSRYWGGVLMLHVSDLDCIRRLYIPPCTGYLHNSYPFQFTMSDLAFIVPFMILAPVVPSI